MEIKFTEVATDHLNYFRNTNNQSILKKIKQLLKNILETPYQGIGKPEALKYQYRGYWSRRINREHRLIYAIDKVNNWVVIYSLKGHY